MSASSKKKLRKEQATAQLTEKQLAEQKEAKKLKAYSIAFIVVIAALLVIAIFVGVNQTIANSGVREKNTTALTVGEHELSNAQLNYYYIDSVNNFYNSYGSYASMFGLDVTKPLDQQYLDEAAGTTWADDFLNSAKESARAVYAMVDAANAADHTLTEDELANIDIAVSNATIYAGVYGYANVDDYLKALYGNGASEEGYREYLEMSILADSYYNTYSNSLTYEDADLRAAEAENYNAYSSFTYNYYYISANKFLEGGTTDEEGNTTYSEEEEAASVAAAEEAAKALTSEEITSVEAFDAAIAALSINADAETPVSSIVYEDYSYDSISELLRDWITDPARKEGDMTYIENSVTSVADHEHTEDEDESAHVEETTVNGYYVLYYISSNDNTFPLANVRHILIEFEGGTSDENDNITYSDEEKAAAVTAAEELLAQWQAGDATEDSFAALANEKSTDTGSNTNGGLYEDVYPGQMVTAFNDWCFAEGRKAGDTGVVETEYGAHIMYYVGDSETSYRDYMIRNELLAADVEEWYAAAVEATSMTDGDTSYISKGLILSAG